MSAVHSVYSHNTNTWACNILHERNTCTRTALTSNEKSVTSQQHVQPAKLVPPFHMCIERAGWSGLLPFSAKKRVPPSPVKGRKEDPLSHVDLAVHVARASD